MAQDGSETGSSLELFSFNGDRSDLTQVEPYYEEFERLRRGMLEKFIYPDYRRFYGKIPGLAGSPDEEEGVALLFKCWTILSSEGRLERYLAEGLSEIEQGPPGAKVRYKKLIAYRRQKSGVLKFQEFEQVRIIFDASGEPTLILPKNKSVNGYRLNPGAKILGS